MFDGQLPGLIHLLLVSLLVGPAAYWAFRQAKGQRLRFAVIWLVIIAALAAIYAYRHELGGVGDRFAAEFRPGTPVLSEGGAVMLRAGANGHFGAFTDLSANGQAARIAMLVDTGASFVVLTRQDARRLGFDPGALAYSVRVRTANGMATGAPILLERVAIGPAEVADVDALVADDGLQGTSLLGMSFLGRLDSFTIAGPEMTLHSGTQP